MDVEAVLEVGKEALLPLILPLRHRVVVGKVEEDAEGCITEVDALTELSRVA